MNTGLRVVCSLKISSRVADCSFVSFSFFLVPLLLLLLLSGLLFSLGCFKHNNPFALSSWSCCWWSTWIICSLLGQISNVRSKEGSFCFCLSFFGTWPPIPSPRLRVVMHGSSSSMAEEKRRERVREKWWSIGKVSREMWKRWY